MDNKEIPGRIKGYVLAFYKKYCAADGLKTVDDPVELFGTELEEILDTAKANGNYSTVNSCYKYFGREYLKDYADMHHIFEDPSIASKYHDTTQDISAESIDLGYSEDVNDIRRAIGRAVQNDNVLNVVKFILNFAYQKKEDGETTYPELKRHKVLFKRYLDRVKPRRLRRFYGKLGEMYLS